MDPLDLPAFEARIDAFDAAVRATADIDHFCSSSWWVLPASGAMMPPREPWILESEHGFAALMRGTHPDVGRYLEPLEAAWCFACPVVGPRPLPLAVDLFAACRARRREWDALYLAGLAPDSILFHTFAAVFDQRYRLFTGLQTRRHLASLDGGVEAFLSRRSVNFRKGIKKSQRRAAELGLTVEACPAPPVEGCDALYQRIVAVEGSSWKGLALAGINVGNMHAFYRAMLPRLVGRGLLRLMFARHEGRDVGFILGGVAGGVYRGLQFSFDDRFREMGLGNLLQLAQMQALVAEGIAVYDLGSDAPYKARWADSTFDTTVLIARR